MKYTLPILIIASSLAGCSMVYDDLPVQEDVTVTVTEIVNINSQGNFRFQGNSMSKKQPVDAFDSKALSNNINFYMRGLIQDLISNLQYVNKTTPVAVTSFALLDSDLQQTNLLGNQIAESLIHELHKAGFLVLDFKVTDSLRITQEGDFISSRDFNDLTATIPIRYIVTGNLVKHQGGYLVNARVVGLTSKVVVASAQSFIPAHVAKAILSSKPISSSEQAPSRVPLVQG
ncbi:FlgO family outer membrane protein [Colwellia sp. TT2012]|uniref:FlgO family outer membrane protein n=1 Tax=Colwellia sp. TT2012 TaxID=1720342 RepID=UPI000710EC52|nr:FlgO family outer membrane protein [Colwellia sp. TT2012]